MAGSGTNIPTAFTTWKQAHQRERVAYRSLRPADTFMCACLRPTETACFCVRKCPNNCCRHSKVCTICICSPVSVSHRHAKRCVCWVHIRKQFFWTWNLSHACVSFMRTKSVLLRWTPSLNDLSKLRGECIAVKRDSVTRILF